MYQSTASYSFEKPTNPITTTVEESSLKFEIKKFYTLCSVPNAESKKVELLSIDAVWWATVTKSLDRGYECCNVTVYLEAKPEGSYVSKNFVFNVEAKIDDIQFFNKNPLQTNEIGKWTFNSVTYTCSNAKLTAIVSSKDSLVLDFKLTVVHTSNGTQMETFHDPTVMKHEIVASNSKMLGDSTFSDFTFIVQGKQFKVHKNILAAASEVFFKLFTTKMAESEKNECKVTHLDPTAFEPMLRFIYSGKLPENFNAEMARDLYEAAHYYDIKTLKKVCEQEVLHKLEVENALELYKWAQVYDQEELKKEAWVIIKRDLLKIFFPLENEPLSPVDVQKILEYQARRQAEDREFWMPFKVKEVKLSSNEPKA